MPQGLSIGHNVDPVPMGVGFREETVHPASGLRIQTVTAHGTTVPTAFHGGTSAAPLGGTTLALGADLSATTWTLVSATGAGWNGLLPTPMTPTITVDALSGATSFTMQFRATGYDQFGNHIEELTPPMIVSGYDLGFTERVYLVTLSKVFSYVEAVYARGTLLALTRFGFGYLFIADKNKIEDHANTLAAAGELLTPGLASWMNTLGTLENWGIGTPLRVSPYGFDPLAATPATSVFTTGANPANGNTVTIDGVVYTFRTTLTHGTPNEILIGGTEAASIQNLADAINGSGNPGVQYTSATPRHPTFRASAWNATTITVAYRIAGSTGNGKILADNFGGSWSVTTTVNGADSSTTQWPEIMGGSGVLLRERATPTVINTARTWPVYGPNAVPTGLCLGKSATPKAAGTAGGAKSTITYEMGPWQGCPHKIGIKSTDAFATAPFAVTGTSTRDLTTTARFGEDEMMFSCTIRSHLGTQRDVHSSRSYPR